MLALTHFETYSKRGTARRVGVALLLAFGASQVLACGGTLGADQERKNRVQQSDDVYDAGTEVEERDDSRPDEDDTATDVERDDEPGTNDESDPNDTGNDPDDANPDETDPDDTDPEDQPIPPAPGESTRLARLTHSQYQNTIYELLGISDGPAPDFAPDALNGFAFQTSIDFRVDARLGPQYRAGAESLAERAAGDAAVLSRIVPCDDQSCAAQFIEEFGLKAFRRPLTNDELAGYGDLFTRGSELVGSGDNFLDGVRLVVEAMLQSPQFIYRTELGDALDADGNVLLDAWQVASRLSFFLYDSMPDQPLLDAAAADQLATAEQLSAQVQRMLADSRATRNLVAFHEQAWRFSRYTKIAPDNEVFGDLPTDLGARMSQASSRYIQEVIETGGGFAELLTAPYAYADSTLAPLYGVDGGDELARIDLNADQRKGYLMQAGFLAANAYARKTDPIHRGLFVVRDLLCRAIPDPPANAAQTPPPEGAPDPETTRDEITILTGQDNCVGCHSLFNPAGFAFEGFDAIGQARTQENGVNVDTQGQIQLDGAALNFDNALTLVDALAASPEARNCYAGKWLEFAHGRTLASDERSAAEPLANASSIEALVLSLATSPGFLSRKPNEVAQ